VFQKNILFIFINNSDTLTDFHKDLTSNIPRKSTISIFNFVHLALKLISLITPPCEIWKS